MDKYCTGIYNRYAKVESLHTLETLRALGENLPYPQPVTSIYIFSIPYSELWTSENKTAKQLISLDPHQPSP